MREAQRIFIETDTEENCLSCGSPGEVYDVDTREVFCKPCVFFEAAEHTVIEEDNKIIVLEDSHEGSNGH